MFTITLAPILHRNTQAIAICFTANSKLNNIVKKIAGIKWSHTHTCWYLPLSRENYIVIKTAFKNTATINNRELKEWLEKRNRVQATMPIATKTKTTRIGYQSKAYSLSTDNLTALQKLIQHLTLKAYSPNTIATYRTEFMQLLQLLQQKSVDSLSINELKRYMEYCIKQEHISEHTAHSRLNALKFYFEQVLGREKFFWEIPRPKKPTQLPKILSEEKIIEGLLTVQNIKHKTILLLAYSAGLRVSEVVQLKVTDINSDRMQITVLAAKGKKDRVVGLSKAILVLLRQYYVLYKPATWLFEGQSKEAHYSIRSAQIIFKTACRKLRLPPQCSFHSLRHSYATHLLDNGTDIAYIQKLLGHNDIKTTLRYIHVSKKDTGNIESPLDKLLRKRDL
jgi:integrase/recombinase XerD